MYKFSKSQAARAKAMQKVEAKATALRRLRKDRPDLHARVLSVIARLANEDSPGHAPRFFLSKREIGATGFENVMRRCALIVL